MYTIYFVTLVKNVGGVRRSPTQVLSRVTYELWSLISVIRKRWKIGWCHQLSSGRLTTPPPVHLDNLYECILYSYIVEYIHIFNYSEYGGLVTIVGYSIHPYMYEYEY